MPQHRKEMLLIIEGALPREKTTTQHLTALSGHSNMTQDHTAYRSAAKLLRP